MYCGAFSQRNLETILHIKNNTIKNIVQDGFFI